MVKNPAEPSTITFSDVDFITKSKAFRELPGKAQMTLLPDGITATDRLGHTLSVHRGACTVARALGLNETRAAAIALGHDVGHGPFGRAFETALTGSISGGFQHAIHSVRRLRELERLPVSMLVFQGIASHTKGAGNFLDVTWASSQEGSIVKIVDAISYCSDDFEKSLARGWVALDDVPGAALSFLGRDPKRWELRLLQDLVDGTHSARGEVRMSPPGGTHLWPCADIFKAQFIFL